MRMNCQELLETEGGAITATLVNAIISGVQKIFEFGRSVGSSLGRFLTHRFC